jgi:hypothetical protein
LQSLPTTLEKPRRTARDREARRIRIMALVQSGYSYEAIAREENLTRERIRQIVARSLEDERGSRIDGTRVQIARLEPAFRLAARGVANGELDAIQPMLRILAQLDKYDAVVVAHGVSSADIRRKLAIRIERMASRMQAEARSAPRDENRDESDLDPDSPTTP